MAKIKLELLEEGILEETTTQEIVRTIDKKQLTLRKDMLLKQLENINNQIADIDEDLLKFKE